MESRSVAERGQAIKLHDSKRVALAGKPKRLLEGRTVAVNARPLLFKDMIRLDTKSEHLVAFNL